jgi:hypothetical protein
MELIELEVSRMSFVNLGPEKSLGIGVTRGTSVR